MLKNIKILLTGTIIAQIIPLLAMPILTRIYTPADFGVLAIFLSCVNIFAIFSNFRLDAAIVSSTDPREQLILRNLSMFFTVILSIIVFILLIVFSSFFKGLYKDIDYSLMLYLTPVYILVFGFLQLVTYIANSKGTFKLISQSKVDKNLSTTIFQIILNKIDWIHGLIVGVLLGFILPLIRFLKSKNRSVVEKRSKLTLNEYYNVLIKYKNYPLISMPTAAMDSMAVELPVLFMNKFHDQNTVGYFDLAKRVILQPLSFISVSVSQVYMKRITEENSNYIKVKITSIIVFILFIISLLIVGIMFVWSEPIFLILFGKEWGVLNDYIGILIFPFLIKFIVSPLSVVFLLPKNIKIGSIWQILYLITSFSVALFFMNGDIYIYFKAFAISEIFIYIIYLALIYYTLIRKDKEV